jgi:hypothetical protein
MQPLEDPMKTMRRSIAIAFAAFAALMTGCSSGPVPLDGAASAGACSYDGTVYASASFIPGLSGLCGPCTCSEGAIVCDTSCARGGATEDASAPLETEDASNPGVTYDASRPTEAEDASNPGVTYDASEPVETEDASNPGVTYDASEPVETEDASAPACH